MWALQWGRRRSSTETQVPHVRISSRLVLQWGRRRSSTETCDQQALRFVRHYRFNGAVDDRRRRPPIAVVVRPGEVAASMGPSTIVDGDAVAANAVAARVRA